MSRRGFAGAVLDRAVGTVGRRAATAGDAEGRIDRRSMLRRSTMAATAVAAVPADFLLRPKSAYAAVCGCAGQGCPCGSLCCDGYTEFCCTLTGQNGCPPGTIAGGWWKVDGSGFCGGAPRYYMDCNAQCGGCGCRGGICDGSCSGTRCGCANGDCNNRKAGCTKFRYGQCNQNIACLGPIVCRIVTCVAPWVFDGSCTTASRTDNRTANHNSPCLGAPFGAFDSVTDAGAAMRLVGWAIDQDRRDGCEVRLFVDERPMETALANLPRGDIAAAFPAFGDRHGFDVTLPANPGRHVVCVLAADRGSGATIFLAFRTVDISGPLGGMDLAEGGPGSVRVVGWAADPRSLQDGSRLRLVANGQVVSEFTTAVARPDVVASLAGAHQNTGFDATFAFAPGTYEICVEMLYPSGYTARLGGCREVVVT